MLYTKIITISAIVTAALLSGCSSGGGGAIAPVTIATAPPPLTPIAPGTSVTTQCAANTFCSVDAITVSEPVTITLTGPNTATVAFSGAPAVRGATAFAATLDPATKYPTSATVSGGINTSVAPLTLQNAGILAGTFKGTAANGQLVVVTAHGQGVPATAASPAGGLTYSNFGDWVMAPVSTGTQTYYMSAWAGGTQFTTTMPTTGTATYTGIALGSTMANTTGAWTMYDLAGNLALTANFTPAGGAITGNITGITAVDFTGAAAGSFNDVALAGTITGNAFSGTATAGALPAGINPSAIAANTIGTTAGHFYGPNANEVTGVWSISAPTAFAAGSFGAKQ